MPHVYGLHVPCCFVSFCSPYLAGGAAYRTYGSSGSGICRILGELGRACHSRHGGVFGFGAVFTLVGAGVGVAGGAFLHHRRGLELVAGLAWRWPTGAVLLLGGGTWAAGPEAPCPPRPPAGRADRGGAAGVAFAVGWTPCIGPTLTAILGLAASSGHAGGGVCGRLLCGPRRPLPAHGCSSPGPWVPCGPSERHSGTAIRSCGALLVVAGVLVASDGRRQPQPGDLTARGPGQACARVQGERLSPATGE